MKKRILVCIRHEMMQHWFKWDINNVCWTLCIKKSISAAMFERSEESPWTVRVDYSAGAWLKAFWNPVHPHFYFMMFADKRQPAFALPNIHVTGTAVHAGRCRCSWRTLRYQQTTHAFNISFPFFALQGNWARMIPALICSKERLYQLLIGYFR